MAPSKKKGATAQRAKDSPPTVAPSETATSRTESTRPQRAATKRHYTSTYFPGYGNKRLKVAAAKPSGGEKHVDDAIRSSKRKIHSSDPELQSRPNPFPFLRLPAELRNIIYNYALTDMGILMRAGSVARKRVTIPLTADNLTSYRPSLSPSLLATNRQIYTEAAPVLYGQTIAFPDTYSLYYFLKKIGSARVLLERITLKSWTWTNRMSKAFALLAECTNLKQLCLDCTFYCWSNKMRIAKQVYPEARLWLESVGRRKGRRSAGVDLIEFGEDARRAHSLTYGVQIGWELDEIDEKLEDDFRTELRKLLEKAG